MPAGGGPVSGGGAPADPGSTVIVHASCVAFPGAGVLILGAAGSGKSALALQLMAIGAGLVADDRTQVRATPTGLVAAAPPTLHGLIEARGVGLLRAAAEDSARLVLAVTLDETETERLPQRRELRLLDRALPLLHKVESAHFPAAIRQYLTFGKAENR